MRPSRASIGWIVAAAFAAAAGTSAAPAAAQAPQGYRAIPVETIPPVPGIRVAIGNRTTVTNRRGRGVVLVRSASSNPNQVGGTGLGDLLQRRRRLLSVRGTSLDDGGRAAFAYFHGGDALRLLLDTFYEFRPLFISTDGQPVDARRIESYTLKSRHGVRMTVKGGKPVELQASRVVTLNEGFVSKEIPWTIESVMVDGTNVVNRGQQRFSPRRLDGPFAVRLLFYPAKFTSDDAIFGFHVGAAIRLRYPNGRVREYPFGPDDTVTLPALPRGDYEVDVTGLGIMPTRPVALSRGQVVELKMISFLDIAFIAVAFVAVLIGLVVARRPHLRSPAHIRVHAAGLAAGRRQAAARQSAGVIRIPVRRFPESDREADAPASAEGAGKPVGETR